MAMFNRCIKESTGLWFPGTLLVLILFCSLTSVGADGPQHRKHVGFRNRCVDMLLVDDDLRLPGIALPSDEKDRVRFLVRTQWLQKNHPNFLETSIDPSVHAAATRFSKRVTEGLQAEIARLRQEPQPNIQQIGLLEEALVRMEPPSSEDGELIIVDIPRSQTRRLQTQIDNRRPIGLVGILLGVPECEEISWQDVRADLLQRPSGEVSEAMEQARRLLQPPIQNGENGDDLVRKTVDAILACIDIQSGRVCRIIE
ncbi:MAG: hypothetical protein KDA91_25845, partial [Planctomycetaceae bacterium]|nr:hypothetical protein [Planctomycetaceae bacterium]